MAISCKLPENYNAPSGTKEGEEFSDLATFKIEGDELHLVAIGEDKTPVGGKDYKKEEKPKGAKQAIKEQLSAMEDKSGKAEMEDSGEDYAEGGKEE